MLNRLFESPLTRLLTMGLAICLLSTVSYAQPPNGGKGKGDRAKGDRARMERGNGQRGARGGDPASFASKAMEEQDKNGDRELQVAELASMLAAQRTQQGNRGGNAGPQGPRAAGNGPRGARQGGPRATDQQPGQRSPRGAGQAGPRGQRGGASGQRGSGQRGPGQRGMRGAEGRGTEGRGAGQRNPADQIAAKLMETFDKNQSNGLDLQELTATLEAQSQRRFGRGSADAEGARRGGPGNAGRDGGTRSGGRGKGRRGEGDESEPGAGVAPKKPGS